MMTISKAFFMIGTAVAIRTNTYAEELFRPLEWDEYLDRIQAHAVAIMHFQRQIEILESGAKLPEGYAQDFEIKDCEEMIRKLEEQADELEGMREGNLIFLEKPALESYQKDKTIDLSLNVAEDYIKEARPRSTAEVWESTEDMYADFGINAEEVPPASEMFPPTTDEDAKEREVFVSTAPEIEGKQLGFSIHDLKFPTLKHTKQQEKRLSKRQQVLGQIKETRNKSATKGEFVDPRPSKIVFEAQEAPLAEEQNEMIKRAQNYMDISLDASVEDVSDTDTVTTFTDVEDEKPVKKVPFLRKMVNNVKTVVGLSTDENIRSPQEEEAMRQKRFAEIQKLTQATGIKQKMEARYQMTRQESTNTIMSKASWEE